MLLDIAVLNHSGKVSIGIKSFARTDVELHVKARAIEVNTGESFIAYLP
jgi:hypothetical protein|tara:strand:- start:422 stop:568 length:147 start_codon:yes stop_codon:yes gene_type:complete